MGRLSALGNPPVPVDLRQSPRARRMTLRVSSLDGKVTLTVPPGTPRGAADKFLAGKADWIARARARAPLPETVGIGSAVPVEGRMRSIVAGQGRGVRICPDRIETAPGANPGRSVLGALKVLARDRVSSRLDLHAGALGRPVARLTLRDTRGRWGSCTSDGAIMLSWRLILAPPDVLDYVVAHEAAHLVEMNHSRAFWALVERLCPDHARHRAWLRAEGPALHRFRFD